MCPLTSWHTRPLAISHLRNFVKIELEYHQLKGGPSYTPVEHSLGVTVSESFITLVGKPHPPYLVSRVICTASTVSNGPVIYNTLSSWRNVGAHGTPDPPLSKLTRERRCYVMCEHCPISSSFFSPHRFFPFSPLFSSGLMRGSYSHREFTVSVLKVYWNKRCASHCASLTTPCSCIWCLTSCSHNSMQHSYPLQCPLPDRAVRLVPRVI